MWGGILGVLVGLMVGIYALPPILKHYYGEKTVAAGQTWSGEGRTIRVGAVLPAIDFVDPPDPGKKRWDFYASVYITTEAPWSTDVGHWSLEVSDIDDWQVATDTATGATGRIEVPPGQQFELPLRFIVQVDEDFEGRPTPEALHLSDPRLKFELE